MSDKPLVPFSDLPTDASDLNFAVEQASKTIALLRHMGIEKATFNTGTQFSDNQNNGVATIATNGVIVQQRTHTTTVTFRHERSTEQEAIGELASLGITQTMQGAFSGGKSQSWASVEQSKIDADE